jgi:hypothetical protein
MLMKKPTTQHLNENLSPGPPPQHPPCRALHTAHHHHVPGPPPQHPSLEHEPQCRTTQTIATQVAAAAPSPGSPPRHASKGSLELQLPRPTDLATLEAPGRHPTLREATTPPHRDETKQKSGATAPTYKNNLEATTSTSTALQRRDILALATHREAPRLQGDAPKEGTTKPPPSPALSKTKHGFHLKNSVGGFRVARTRGTTRRTQGFERRGLNV